MKWRLLAIGVLVGLALLTHRRTYVFHDNTSLWMDAVRLHPCSARPWGNLATTSSDPEVQSEAWRHLVSIVVEHRCVE